jgi:hypothetical protein
MDTPTARVIRRDASTLATVLDHPQNERERAKRIELSS